MGYVMYKQQQSENACKKHNKRIMSSDCKGLPVRFPHKQIVSAWRELPDEQQSTLFLIDVEQLSEEKVAEIMGVPRVIVKNRAIWARVLLKKKFLSYCRSSRTYRK